MIDSASPSSIASVQSPSPQPKQQMSVSFETCDGKFYIYFTHLFLLYCMVELSGVIKDKYALVYLVLQTMGRIWQKYCRHSALWIAVHSTVKE